jgi:dCMP deaminase
MLLAEHWAQYSTCIRRQVGAVIYDPDSKTVISIGYNDTPIGEIDCGDGGCRVCEGPDAVRDILACKCIHSESNAIAFAARLGHRTLGHWLVSTFTPCATCRKLMIQAGIAKAIWPMGEETFSCGTG